MGTRLAGRTALVTGAGNGIGREIALLLGVEGASVVVNDLGTDEHGLGVSSEAADATVADIVAAGGTAVANYDSIAEADGCVNAVMTAIDAFGQCDIVIANAGAVVAGGEGIQSPDDYWTRLSNLYLGQKFWLTRKALPPMLERGWGRFVYATSEIARGTQATPLGAAVFNGGIGMAHDLANQHRNDGVTFNCYAPGAATRAFEAYKTLVDEGLRAKGVPEDQWSQFYLPPAECVAPMVVWLCTDAAADINGEVFGVSGTRVGRWTHQEVGKTLIKEGDERGVWSLDELDELVPKELMSDS